MTRGAGTRMTTSTGDKSGASRLFSNVNLGDTTHPHKRQVSYWAGLRVEGGLSPFGMNCDDLTRWNDKINNGGLFEKIGNGLKM